MNEIQKAKIERRWRWFKEHFGYTDEELAIHRSNPKHVKAMEGAPKFATHRMVIEVIESHGCVAGYKVGDRFAVDTEGCLIPDEYPPRLCTGAIAALNTLVTRMWQAFYDDSTDVFQDTIHCSDVDVHKGGYGVVTMRIYAVPKKPRDK
jgi:uncharacterized repeat protein (TIGR04076 family)